GLWWVVGRAGGGWVWGARLVVVLVLLEVMGWGFFFFFFCLCMRFLQHEQHIFDMALTDGVEVCSLIPWEHLKYVSSSQINTSVKV
ncbi:unnamed protein product, partial [Penicillium nalgiovense]